MSACNVFRIGRGAHFGSAVAIVLAGLCGCHPSPETTQGTVARWALEDGRTPFIEALPGTNVQVEALFNVGDSVNLKPDGTPYYLVGVPDGLGAFVEGEPIKEAEEQGDEVSAGKTAGMAKARLARLSSKVVPTPSWSC